MNVDQVELYTTPIYRSIAERSGSMLYTPKRCRIPKRVPLLVDNIWEYLRPGNMPSRRKSAFGSPTADLASKFGPKNGTVYRVVISVPCVIAQIAGCSDASYHPDIETITSIFERAALGQRKLDKLTSELLSKQQTNMLLATAPETLNATLNAITFWSQCQRIELGLTAQHDPVGEFFFEAPRGYYLERL